LKAKEKLDKSNPYHRDELRKLLMRRAFRTIPIWLSLQNESQTIDKLYKKGMLTDDIHYKFKALKNYFESEHEEVKTEANELMESWGDIIWTQAVQYHAVSLLLAGGSSNHT
jgi:radical SAM superfamily enzyme YgiQ (UPF0313 family)